MIDTSLLIDYFRKGDKSKARLVAHTQNFERLAISSVTVFEVYSGATAAQIEFWQTILSEIPVLPFDSIAAHAAVDIQQQLKKRRLSIDKADLFIAATAVAHNLTLDTLNRKHFEHIAGLTLWDSSAT